MTCKNRIPLNHGSTLQIMVTFQIYLGLKGLWILFSVFFWWGRLAQETDVNLPLCQGHETSYDVVCYDQGLQPVNEVGSPKWNGEKTTRIGDVSHARDCYIEQERVL